MSEFILFPVLINKGSFTRFGIPSVKCGYVGLSAQFS